MLFKLYISSSVNRNISVRTQFIDIIFCDTRSKHEEIDLVPEEEFFQEAPPDISRPNLTKTDSHQLTLARLDWELEQRKRYINLNMT